MGGRSRATHRKTSPESHPLSSTWSLYAHSQSDAATYRARYWCLLDVDTCEQWGAMVHHIPAAATIAEPRVSLRIYGHPVHSFSFFRDGVTPEWEHPRNESGYTLSARSVRTCADRARLWVDLLCECARGALDDAVLGVQLSSRRGATAHFKIDVWCEKDAPLSCPALADWQRRHSLPLRPTVRKV